DVIENGNPFKPEAQTTTNAYGTSTSLIPGPVTSEEKAQKKNDVKARSMLLMALPNEHLMTFNQYKDAKTLFAAIQTRFGGNDATKKTQKTLIKQMYKNFSALSIESLDSILTGFRRLKITINGSDTAGYDKFKVECFNCHKMGHFARECRGPRNQDNRNRNQVSSRRTVNVEETSSKAMVAIDGAGFDWSYITDDEVPTNMALMAFSDSEAHNDKTFLPPPTGLFSPPKFNLFNSGLEEFQQPKFEGYGPKPSKSVSEDTSNEVRESPDAPLVKKLMSDDKSQSPRGNQRNWNNQKSQQLGSNFVMYNKACFVYGSFDHVHAHYNYHQRERVESKNNYTRVNYNYSTKKTHPSSHRNMVPRAVLMKTGLKAVNTATPVTTAHPKTIVYSARPMSYFSKSAQSTVKRLYQIRTTLTNKNSSQKVNTAKGKFYTARKKAVNTARPNSAVVNAVRANQVNAVKASACWVWRPTKLNSASITLKRHNYVDARGISKSVMLGSLRKLFSCIFMCSVIHKKKIKAMLTVDAQGT
ncbi:ribonuclease H-like domain-containing protein, partial [Tanacetum coccineum]